MRTTIAQNTPVQSREAYFIALYENAFPQVAAFVHKNSGSLEEAKDIFQEALLIFYEGKASQGLSVRDEDAAYLIGICRHLWFRYASGATREQALDKHDVETETAAPEVSLSLLRFVESSGQKCMELLKAFYYDRAGLKAIAARFGFSGERSAAAQKYKCLEKVRNAIRARSLGKEDFYE